MGTTYALFEPGGYQVTEARLVPWDEAQIAIESRSFGDALHQRNPLAAPLVPDQETA